MVADVGLMGAVALLSALVVLKSADVSGPKLPGGVNLSGSVPDPIVFAKAGPRAEYEVIVSNRLFGAGAQTAPPPEPVATPPTEGEQETELQLRLLGTTFAGPLDPLATAIIEVREGPARLDAFYIGEQVVDQVFLKEVRHKEAVLDNRRLNRTELLKMEEDLSLILAKNPPPTPAVRAPVRNTASRVVPLRKAEIQQELTDNYAQIAATVEVHEYRDESGKVVGLTSPNVSQVPLAQKLGFQDNDVLTEINNEPIDSVDKIYDILNKYQNASTFRIGIIRNGQRDYITYRLQ